MRRRGGQADSDTVTNLDSFMDIVTNVIGALFFVVIFAALSAFGATGKVVTPILSEGDTKGVIFECRSNTVCFPDVQGLLDEADAVWKQADEAGDDWDEKVLRLRKAEIANEYYRFVPESKLRIQGGNIVYVLQQKFEPQEGVLGESIAEFQEPDSRFNESLAALDPAKQHVFLLVDTESFEIFHAVRRAIIEQGFHVGWDPIEAGGTLTFGGQGVVDVGSHF
ncbi:MAG: hypothetical protein JXR94_17620 [Candidatus Hydrogenedentes bacterium]|nr:hypothetical protein [Candidatus Hydrogenedentota bacterium]